MSVCLLCNCLWLLLITFAMLAHVSILRLVASVHVSRNWMKIAVQTLSYSKHFQAMWIRVTCFWVTNIQYLGTSEPFAASGNLSVVWKNDLSHIVKTNMYKNFFSFKNVFLHFVHRKVQYISVPFDPCLIFYYIYISLTRPHEIGATGIHSWQDQGFSTSLKHPDQLCGPPSSYAVDTTCSFHLVTVIRIDGSTLLFPLVWLHGMERDCFTLI